MLDALLGFVVLFLLLFLRVPIAFAMGGVGIVGLASIIGIEPALESVGQTAVDTVITYNLSVLPLFIMMGNFVAKSGLAEELYGASHAFLGHRRGGLALATIVACGGFSAVCGSSLATAATISRIAMPSMRRYGYDEGLAAGSIAAGGTLGILIPPSVILVLYGLMTDTDISDLFAAGLIPGILGVLFYMSAISVVTRLKPELARPADRIPWSQRLAALRSTWGILLLFAVVMGGIYFGVFTPTESAGMGAMGAFLFALARRSLDLRALREVLTETALTTSMMFALLIGAIIFTNFLNVSRMPSEIAQWITEAGFGPYMVVALIVIVYLILGCMLDSLSMMFLTVPVFYPIVNNFGMDLVWFGIIVVVVIEIGLITPPIGLNVFMLKTLMPEVPTGKIFIGVLPFIAADVVRLTLLVVFPSVVLLLPNLMSP
jgi:tripartite ATP-independent transporter DctM subunit